MSATTKKDAAMAKAKPTEAADKLDAEAAAARRDVPPGIDEIEAYIREQIEAQAKPPVNLYKAIHAAQAKFPTVRKNGENPHFKSKYATLDEIWEAVKEPLNAAGIIVVCDVYTHNGERLLTTRAIHAATGEEIACTFPIMAATNSPQAIGSAMTYARRYTLTALLEIVTGDGVDDDGEVATNGAPAATTTRNPPASAAAEALGF